MINSIKTTIIGSSNDTKSIVKYDNSNAILEKPFVVNTFENTGKYIAIYLNDKAVTLINCRVEALTQFGKANIKVLEQQVMDQELKAAINTDTITCAFIYLL